MFKQSPGGEQSKALRKRAGAYLKKLREAADLTQLELAERLGIRAYTYISQIENGNGTLNTALMEKAAEAFGVDRAEFGRKMLMYYEPFFFKTIFGAPTKRDLS